MYALTRAQMRRWEEATFAAGVGVLQVMELAGAAVAAHARRMARGGSILILAGKGNNGGDGLVAARRLHAWGCPVVVRLAEEPGTPECAAALAAARGSGVPFLQQAELPQALAAAGLVVDALLGFSLAGAPREPVAGLIEAANAAAGRGVPVLAVDLPSGVLADTGQTPGVAVQATRTVTFGAPKRGLYTEPGATLAGRLAMADIGLLPLPDMGDVLAELASPVHLRDWLPLPGDAIHKGSRGRVLVIAGSRGMAGAAALSVRGALRAGAGLVTSAVPACVQEVVAGLLPESMSVGLPDEGGMLAAHAADLVHTLAQGAGAVAIGPGLGRSMGSREAVRAICRSLPLPLVVDADGLRALAGEPHLLAAAAGPRVLTPHPAELAALLGRQTQEIQADRFAAVLAAAAATRSVVLLKGRHTLVADPDGRLFINTTGHRALATAGSGDVLTGVVAALLAQGLQPLQAAVVAACLHGLAGEAVARNVGPDGGLAGEIADHLPAARLKLLHGQNARHEAQAKRR